MRYDHVVLRAVRRGADVLRPWLGERAYRALYVAGWLGYWPRIERPRTFNEKILWLMRHYRDPLIARVADKLEARAYARQAVPWIELAPLLGVFDRAADLPFDDLPDRAVLKSNHASGHVHVLERPVDVAAVSVLADGWLAERYGESTGEWHYAHVVPRLLVEGFMGTPDGVAPTDYKVHVFGGRAERITMIERCHAANRRIAFDREWRPQPDRMQGMPQIEPAPPRPKRLDALIEAAERLAAPFPYVRVDTYLLGDAIVFGELTFFPSAGRTTYVDWRSDLEVGRFLVLPDRAQAGGRADP